MYSGVMLTLLLPLFAFISSTPLSGSDINDTCLFKDGDKFPSFIYQMGDNTEIILCSNATCLCDGSDTGYKGCQSCCCAIKERTEACDIVNKKEEKYVEKKDHSLIIKVWAIVATTMLVVVCVAWMTLHCYHLRQKKDPSTASTEPLQNSLLSGNSAAVSATETVFLPVETVRTENKEETESQEVQPFSLCEPLNPGA